VIRPPSLVRPEGAWCSRLTLRVIMGDTDAMGIVYYANYLRFFEAARAEMMRQAGLPYAPLFEQGLVLPVAEQWWRYRAPARFDDEIVVTTWVHEAGRGSMLIGCQIRRGDVLLGDGAARLGCIDRSGKVRRLPEELRALAAEKTG
jgi:acyl-CoA thioester hydrolase